MWSLLSIKQQSPRRPCDILVANVGPEIAKTAKTAKTARCAKKCAKLKMFKTALSGVSQQRSVPVCCASQFRPVQAKRPCPSLSSLPQPSPAFSSWLQSGQGLGALPSCPEAQGECLSFRELPREVTGPKSLDSAQGCAQEEHMAISTSSL